MTSMYFKTETSTREPSMYGKTERDLGYDNFYSKTEYPDPKITKRPIGELLSRQALPTPKQSPLEKKQPVEKPQMPKGYGGMGGGMGSRGTMFQNPSALQPK